MPFVHCSLVKIRHVACSRFGMRWLVDGDCSDVRNVICLRFVILHT
jgi:hypothetical protein